MRASPFKDETVNNKLHTSSGELSNLKFSNEFDKTAGGTHYDI